MIPSPAIPLRACPAVWSGLAAPRCRRRALAEPRAWPRWLRLAAFMAMVAIVPLVSHPYAEVQATALAPQVSPPARPVLALPPFQVAPLRAVLPRLALLPVARPVRTRAAALSPSRPVPVAALGRSIAPSVVDLARVAVRRQAPARRSDGFDPFAASASFNPFR